MGEYSENPLVNDLYSRIAELEAQVATFREAWNAEKDWAECVKHYRESFDSESDWCPDEALGKRLTAAVFAVEPFMGGDLDPLPVQDGSADR